MEKEEYYKIYGLEDSHAWYISLREKTLSYILLYRNKNNDNFSILDAGCGSGWLLSHLKNKGGMVVGIDICDISIKLCQGRKLNNVFLSSVSELPFKDNSFDIVTSLDVLYHREVKDDRDSLKEYYRVLKRNGILLLNLPAYNFLKSNHDRFEHGIRRYTASRLKIKLKEVGFSIEKLTYSNTFLFPLIAFRRLLLLKKTKKKFDSDLHSLANIVNKLALLILRFENMLQEKIALPFGLSLFCIARKK